MLERHFKANIGFEDIKIQNKHIYFEENNKMAAISVLMAVYNCDKYLREAIDSILNQTWNDFEFIIVNDGSTDNSLKILQEYDDARIKLITYDENRGVAHARNVGLEYCISEYVALMDADDIALQDRLEIQINFLKEHEDIDGVYAKLRYMQIDGTPIDREWPKAYYNYNYVKAEMLLQNTIANPTVMFRRQIVEQYQIKYDETWKISTDYKFWCDYLKHGRIVGIDKVLCYYRLRNHSIYNNAPMSKKKESDRKIKLYYFEHYGFQFAQKEVDILCKIYGPDDGEIISEEEMILVYEVLLKMVRQAAENNLEFAEEVRIMCRKRFLEKIKSSGSLWNV